MGGTLSPATIHAVLAQAQAAVTERRTSRLSSAAYCAVVVDGIYFRYRRRADRGAREGVLLVALGVRGEGTFQVLDWLAAPAETTAAYEQLFTRLWQRGLEQVEMIVSDGAEAVASAAAMVYPRAAHQLCLVHWFKNLEAVTPPLPAEQRRKLRRDFWWIWQAESEGEARSWALRFRRRWQFWAPEMVQKFQAEFSRVLAYLRFPARWRHRLRTTNLDEGFFRHLRKYLSRFPGCVDPAHSEHILGCFLLAAERMHA